ncbi:DNA mismatch repair protein MutS [Aquisalibacillus elongatus]|uniref:DNA mismatch repair protein MutS n=1 Tax=Aquisalibacillus elongatus TaxID=485577 RepID=A0A3N5BEN6_9BACI|nr:DNA mismatch repair protein MutS [Aquisalibacillus elongatus]RPF55917.1 DNA mismatch repair protein MutS [Aquisalibacillus elongatus]
MAAYTPMIEQYLKIKEANQDAFLLFRLGDFYELFFDDALKAAKELEITLTQRDGGQEKIPMCGVPYHSAERYIKTLIEKGYKVAICEQVEDPKSAKGVVKREVVQVITPGTIMEDSMLNEDENNFIASITPISNDYVVSYVDLSTGESFVSLIESEFKDVLSELYNRPVREIVVPENFNEDEQDQLAHYLNVTISIEVAEHIPGDYEYLVENIDDERLIRGFARVFQYIYHSQKRFLLHLQQVEYIELAQYMKLDLYSKRNLELMESIRDKSKKGTLLSVLDHTATAMGARKLKKWIDRPLLSKSAIEKRHQQVQALMDHFFEREELKEALQDIYDIERLAGRISYGNVNARDLLQLKRSLRALPNIEHILGKIEEDSIQSLLPDLTPYKEIHDLLEKGIAEDPPILITEGGIIKDGYHEQLDEFREASRNGKTWVANLEATERERTGIKSLKIGYNKVFGYYIEITKANLSQVDLSRFERKQTLANAERFITPELKEKERLILEANDKSVNLEYDLFISIRDQMKDYISILQLLADRISQIDVLLSFANISELNNYTKPTIVDEHVIEIEDARHPVVEQVMKEEFVPNSFYLNDNTNILLITGPNMAGKSTYMRQLGLIVIMAQIGCFVPAKSATVPVFDQIFTRIGAADDLVSGQSTFMVEMLESEHAVRQATKQSLILFDEIGRGTSTYDGMALAQSIVEYIHHHIGAKTLFSTHYHELTSLEESLDQLKNVHVEVDEHDGEVVFLHHIQEGKADKSYGVHVAKLANLPDDIIDRANYLLESYEATSTVREQETQSEEQLTLFEEEREVQLTKSVEVIDEIKDANLLNMTPMDAMNLIYQLKKKLD